MRVRGARRGGGRGLGRALARVPRPVLVGERLWVRPPWAGRRDGSLDLVIDPAQAFGTGAHPTTRLSLELLLEPSSPRVVRRPRLRLGRAGHRGGQARLRPGHRASTTSPRRSRPPARTRRPTASRSTGRARSTCASSAPCRPPSSPPTWCARCCSGWPSWPSAPGALIVSGLLEGRRTRWPRPSLPCSGTTARRRRWRAATGSCRHCCSCRVVAPCASSTSPRRSRQSPPETPEALRTDIEYQDHAEGAAQIEALLGVRRACCATARAGPPRRSPASAPTTRPTSTRPGTTTRTIDGEPARDDRPAAARVVLLRRRGARHDRQGRRRADRRGRHRGRARADRARARRARHRARADRARRATASRATWRSARA